MVRPRTTEGPHAYSALTILRYGIGLAHVDVSCTPLHSDDSKGTEIYEEKMKAVLALNCHKAYMRTKLRARAWKMAFPERRHGRIQPAVWRQYCRLQPEEPNDDRRPLGIARTGFLGSSAWWELKCRGIRQPNDHIICERDEHSKDVQWSRKTAGTCSKCHWSQFGTIE